MTTIHIKTTSRLTPMQIEALTRDRLDGLVDLPIESLEVDNIDSGDYIGILEHEGRTFADLLTKFAKTIGELREHRNKLWRENVELKRGKQC
jgi:hypothetical protein